MPHVTVIAPTLPQRAAAAGEEQAKRRVAAYARVSTESEDQHTSYEAQIRYYTQFILAHADWELAGVYTDATCIIGTNQSPSEWAAICPYFSYFQHIWRRHTR